MTTRDLALDEGHDVVELLEPGARLGGPVGDRGETALGDHAHLAVDRRRRCRAARRGPPAGR